MRVWVDFAGSRFVWSIVSMPVVLGRFASLSLSAIQADRNHPFAVSIKPIVP
jgi:hypothetical protein